MNELFEKVYPGWTIELTYLATIAGLVLVRDGMLKRRIQLGSG